MRASGCTGKVLRRFAVAAVVAGLPVAVPLSAPGTLGSGVAVASGKSDKSWDAKRTDEFSGSGLPRGCTQYGGPYEGGKSYWKKEGVRIAGGLLRLRLIQKSGGKGYPFISGGVGCWDQAQSYGRYEVRAKVPRGKGIDSYITLMPSKAGQAQGWTGVELLAPGPTETAYITNGFGAGTETAQMPGTYSDGFHTYVIEWAPNLTQISVDDEVVFSSPKSYKGKRWLGLVVSNGDALTGVPDKATKLPAEFEIDYVKTATFTGVAPAPKPTEALGADDGPAASATTQATPGAAKVPATTPAAVALTSATDEDEGTGLAGGVWPWLLGGSMIAGLAVISLSYPRGRRSPAQPPAQPRRGMRRRSPQPEPAEAGGQGDTTIDVREAEPENLFLATRLPDTGPPTGDFERPHLPVR